MKLLLVPSLNTDSVGSYPNLMKETVVAFPNQRPLAPHVAVCSESPPDVSVWQFTSRPYVYISFWEQPFFWQTWGPEFPPPPPLHSHLYGIFWGLRKADLSVPPQKICHTGAVVLGVGGEILVVKWGDGWHGKAARKARRLDRPPPAARVCCYLIVLLLVLLLLLLLLMIMMKVAIILNNNNNNHNNNTYYYH